MDAYAYEENPKPQLSDQRVTLTNTKYVGELDHVIVNNQPVSSVMAPGTYRLQWQSMDANDPHRLESNYQPNPVSEYLDFDEKTIRAGYFRKVFLILSCMLLVVFGFIALFLFESHCKQFVQTHSWVFYTSIPIFLVTFTVVILWKQSRRVHPYNLISLAIVTFSLGYVTATVSSYFDVTIVFTAMGICVVSCIAIMAFTVQTRFDFGSWIGVLYTVLVVLILVAIVSLSCLFAFDEQEAALAAYAGIITMVLMLFFAIGVGIISKDLCYREYEEYISGAILLFVSIISIILVVLFCVALAAGGGCDKMDCNGCFCYCGTGSGSWGNCGGCGCCGDCGDCCSCCRRKKKTKNQQEQPSSEENKEQH